MKVIRFLFKLQLALLALCAISTAKTADTRVFHYRIQVRVEPTSHKLEADAWIQHPPALRFSLNKNLSIGEITADGKSVAFHRDPASPTSIVVETPAARELRVRYEGQIDDVVAGVNQIRPELVELALYAKWYPAFQHSHDYTFDIEANLPQGYRTTTNGKQLERRQRDGRLITRWTSYLPGFDMVLLASPKLHEVEGGTNDIRVEMYHSQLPEELLNSKMNGLTAAMNRLSNLYGQPQVKGVLRFAYSPRAGWGYSRMPLFVVSEQYASQKLSDKDYGEAGDFLDNCHELSHFWWNIVDLATPNDWINEGLAEFSAFLLAQERYGKPFAEKRIAEYRQHAAQSKTTSAIAETEGNSPDRYVNRYEKTTLMFLEALRRFGEESLFRFLKELYARFAGTHQATTELFLQQVHKFMGAEAETFFREELFRTSRQAL